MPRVRMLVVLALIPALASCTTSGATPQRPESSSPLAPLTSPAPSASEVPSPPPALRPDDPWTSLVVEPPGRYVPMFDQPFGARADFVMDTRNPTGRHAPLLIEGVRVDDAGSRWLKVLLPVRPNGSTAWVREDDVLVGERTEEIIVDLSERTLERYRDGELVNRFRVGVGQPQYPTAIGTFYVWIKVPFEDYYGPYGIFALGLSGFSPVLSDWPGGGRMAIHGTADPTDRGRQVSHGCIRVYNEQLRELRDVPLGTPVVIRR